jgi:hypothetical protein
VKRAASVTLRLALAAIFMAALVGTTVWLGLF